MSAPPLVSCVMPTANRRRFVPRAIAQFQRQTYERKELVIVDDGQDCIEDLVPKDDPRIRYLRIKAGLTLGAKRNVACEAATGALLATWDDDDWQADQRLAYQIKRLRRSTAGLVALGVMYFARPLTRHAWRALPPPGGACFVHASAIFTRAFYASHPFPDWRRGEDQVLLEASGDQLLVVWPHVPLYVQILHHRNTVPKELDDGLEPYDYDELERVTGNLSLPGDDAEAAARPTFWYCLTALRKAWGSRTGMRELAAETVQRLSRSPRRRDRWAASVLEARLRR